MHASVLLLSRARVRNKGFNLPCSCAWGCLVSYMPLAMSRRRGRHTRLPTPLGGRSLPAHLQRSRPSFYKLVAPAERQRALSGAVQPQREPDASQRIEIVLYASRRGSPAQPAPQGQQAQHSHQASKHKPSTDGRRRHPHDRVHVLEGRGSLSGNISTKKETAAEAADARFDGNAKTEGTRRRLDSEG